MGETPLPIITTAFFPSLLKEDQHGIPDRQKAPDHGCYLQPFHRLRHRQGLPPRRRGARLHVRGERFADRVAGFAAEFGSDLCLPMDVGSDEEIAAVAAKLSERWGGLDGFVHSIGFAPREAIAGDFLDGISRDAFRVAMDISAYSFPALARPSCLPHRRGRNASILTLTYIGG